MGVDLPLPDEGDSGEAEDGTKAATGNEESLASPLAGGQTHRGSIRVSHLCGYIINVNLNGAGVLTIYYFCIFMTLQSGPRKVYINLLKEPL